MMIPALFCAKRATITGHFWRSALVSVVAGLLLFGPVGVLQNLAQLPSPSFEVASIKPNRSGDLRMMISSQPGRYTATGVTTKRLIEQAYGVKDFQISGGPSWVSSDRYDVDAKVEESVVTELQKLPPNQMAERLMAMIRLLLADRFKLEVSHTTKELPVYALVVAKTGPKLHEAKPGETYPNGIKGPDGRPVGGAGMMRMGPGQLIGQGLATASLAALLSQQLGRTVMDQTGLKSNYDFTLQWTPDQRPAATPVGPVGGSSGADGIPPRFFRAFPLHCASGTTWAETGIDKGSGGYHRHRSYREAFRELAAGTPTPQSPTRLRFSKYRGRITSSNAVGFPYPYSL